IVAALIALATASCRKHDTVVESGLTGITLTVNYQASLSLTALAFSATTANGAPAFAPGVLPNPPRQLNPTSESAVVLVPAALGGTTVTVRVDGLAGMKVAGSQQQAVALKTGELVSLTMTLGDPAVCGDSIVRMPIEQCDDGNTMAGDGCSPTCQTETGTTC